MPDAFFRWLDCTDKTRPRDLGRSAQTALRFAHLTDPHLPNGTELFGRLTDLVGEHGSMERLSKEISAISNEFGHAYRSNPERYTNILKKTFLGLHPLGVDHLLLTGDLAHCGLSPEFAEMRAILELTDWWGEDRVTIVPGNHDRFNLYEHIDRTSMEAYFPVVRPREPRYKLLSDDVALLEIDTNRDPDDPHHLEQWLPNTIGRIYPEVVDWVDSIRDELAGRRVIVLLHHHVTSDWYDDPGPGYGGLMRPVEGYEALVEAVETIDPRALILHGHKHDVMPIDYTDGTHRLSCPGGFHDTHTLNLIDIDTDRDATLTQLELRV
jgi:calcineurin-like phosphoesterase family protein